MVATTFVIVGVLALVFAGPGVFWPEGHRARVREAVADDSQVRILAFMSLALGGLELLVGRGVASFEEGLLCGLGVLQAAAAVALFLMPGLYRRLIGRLASGPTLLWSQLCLFKVVVGAFFISWGIHEAF